LCDGSLLDAGQYPALFAVLGMTYGGSGQSFALPDLRGRVLLGG
jgi:microcystin-dependent protein